VYNIIKNGLRRLYYVKRDPSVYTVKIPENIDEEIQNVLNELELSDEEMKEIFKSRTLKKDIN